MVELINQYLTEASQDYELTSMKITAVMEAAKRQLAINYSEAELKVMKENGTTDDYLYLVKEADNGMVETVIAAIEKIKKAIIKFCTEMREKVISLLSSKETNDALDAVEKKIKLFPVLGKKKILVENYNAEEKCVSEHISKLNKLKAKLKSGQEVTTEDVAKVEKDFIEEHGKLIGVGSAVAITVAAAIAFIKKANGDANGHIRDTEKEGEAICDEMEDLAKKLNAPAVAQKIASAVTSIVKTRTEDFIRCVSNARTGIKNAIKTHGTKLDASKVLKESTDEGDVTGTDTSTTEKDIEKAADAAATPDNVKTEDGDDDGLGNPTIPDDEPDTDPWDDVMKQLDDDTDHDLMDDGDDDPTTSFERAYNELFNDITLDHEPVFVESSNEKPIEEPANISAGRKPSNDEIITDLFNSIVSDVRTKNGSKIKNPVPAEPVKESTFDRLMGEIDQLQM